LKFLLFHDFSGAVLLVACLAGGSVVDRLGRKFLLLISAFFMTLMLIALGVYFFLVESESEVVDSLGWLPLTSLCIFLIAYSIGFGPLPWLLISEVYSKDYNAIASPLNGCFSWLLAFAVTATFGTISDAIGIGATFMIFAGLSCLGIFFTYFVVIETKAKTMLEIQRILAGEKNV
jgi:MFS family permease